MKKQFLKIIGSTLIAGAFLILAYGSDESKDKSSPNSSTSNSATSNSFEDNKPSEWTCNICKNKFTGHGYELTYEGNCKELDENHQGFLCSCSCAKRARQNFNNAVDNALNNK
jgi:hypothetical protein